MLAWLDVDTVRRAVQDMGNYRGPDYDPSMMTPHDAALEAAKPSYRDFDIEKYMPASPDWGDSFLSIIQSILPYTPYGLVSDWFYQPSLSEAVNSIDPRTVGKQPVQPEAVYPW